MSETLYEIRQTQLLSLGDGNTPANPLLRMGIPAKCSKWDLFALMGRMYNLKQTTIGTALSGATANNAGIVVTVPWVRFTVPTGYTVFPRHLNLSIAGTTGGADPAAEMALVYSETDSFTSGGTALTPLNWRSDNPRATCVTNCYVGPTGGANVEAAMTRPRAIYQDIVATPMAANQTDQYVVDLWFNDLIPIVGPSVVLLFLTGKTATPTAYFSMDWAEVQTVNVKES
jgi:hypothetical protein